MPSFYISPVDDHLAVLNWNSARSVSLAKKMMIAGVVGDHALCLVVIAETGLGRLDFAGKRHREKFNTCTSRKPVLPGLNLVERWFGLITEKQIRRESFRSTRELEEAIGRYVETYNQNPRPFIWTKTADQIFESLKNYCEESLMTHHTSLTFSQIF